MQVTSTAAAADFVRTKPELDALSIPEVGYVEAYDDPSPFVWRGIIIDSFGRKFSAVKYSRWSAAVFPEWEGSTYGQAVYRFSLKRALRKALKK